MFALSIISGPLKPSPAEAQTLSFPDLVSSYKKALQKGNTVEIVNENKNNKESTQQSKVFSPSDSAEKDTQAAPSQKEILEAAEFASNATGVRKDFLIGMLVVESNLGQNTGKCTYQEVENGAEDAYRAGRLSWTSWQTFQQRKSQIKGIANELGYDYEAVKVSCNPSNYVGTGGALGIPQFMPDTWLDYKPQIAKIVGKENPDPWNVRDGVVAMAVKLADVNGVTDHNRLAERNAAKMYLSGTTSWQYDWYANQIFFWSQHYNELVG